ncbi:MAG: patatin-like phospholipase family protein [Candidatus Heimdallarchaeaceae archaeon]|jgi:NTE family protein
MTKVSKENVKYLAFEGGGGKGITYLGALQALEELGIMSHVPKKKGDQTYPRLDSNKIKGVAGTSIGSLTALLIACGYNSEEISIILTSDVSDNILDTVDFGTIPTIYSKDEQDCVIQDSRFGDVDSYMKTSWANFVQSDQRSLKGLLEIPVKTFKRMSFSIFALILQGYLNHEIKKTGKGTHDDEFHLVPIQDIMKSETQIAATQAILNKPIHSINSLKYEYGFFLGGSARHLFDQFIEDKSGIKNCTFEQFYEEFGIDLVITSVCLNTGKAFYFKNEGKWKDLCVADAVRMSIGIPFLFKPVLFEEKEKSIGPFTDDLQTTRYMVDGGVVDNFPLHAFDEEGKEELNSQMIGFTLVPDSKKKVSEIANFTDYLDNALYTFLKNATELQIKTSGERDQIIELDTGNLSIFDFSFEELPEEIITSSKERTLEYFK